MSQNKDLSNLLIFSPEAEDAIRSKKPIVALESTIISHGMPYPKNIDTALEVESLIRSEGATPATIAISEGKIRIGLNLEQLEIVGKPRKDLDPPVLKLSRRDIPYALAKKCVGATTVAATMICAELAGIRVFATGGIGGVHREAEKTFDISADLQELSKTNVAVVCAGVKSILDIGLTLEVMETLGVPVIGYQTNVFPAFYSRESAFHTEYRMDDPNEIARLLKYRWMIGSGGALIVNPVPEANELPREFVEEHILDGLRAANKAGIQGKNVTPFLLSHIVSKTNGKSLVANIALVKNNALLGAAIAKELTTEL